MKTRLLSLIILLSFSIQAQEMKTILSGDVEISGFGGFNLGLHSIDGATSVGFGGGGAMLINQRFWIGGFGEGVPVNKSYSYETLNSGTRIIDLNMGYGGMWLGYKIRPNEVIHPQLDLRLGWGGMSAEDGQTGELFASTSIFVFNPNLGVEANITNVFRVQLSAGYRGVSGADFEFADSSDFSGFVANLGFVFGGFY